MGETPGKMYALATVLTLLAAAAVLLRIYARKIKRVILAWDDYLILAALVGWALRMMYLLIWNSRIDEAANRCSQLALRCACLSVSIHFQRVF